MKFQLNDVIQYRPDPGAPFILSTPSMVEFYNQQELYKKVGRYVPDPKPIEVGCKILFGGELLTVLAIDDDIAWLKKPNGSRVTYSACLLTRVD